MRRMIPIMAMALALSLAAGAAWAAIVGNFSVEISRSKRVMLPGTAATISIADPHVADVAVLDSRSVVVVGKSFGVTDIIISDHSGKLLMDTRVAVVPIDAQHLTVIRGPSEGDNGPTLSDYVCVARCSQTGTGANQASLGLGGASGTASSATVTTPQVTTQRSQ